GPQPAAAHALLPRQRSTRGRLLLTGLARRGGRGAGLAPVRGRLPLAGGGRRRPAAQRGRSLEARAHAPVRLRNPAPEQRLAAHRRRLVGFAGGRRCGHGQLFLPLPARAGGRRVLTAAPRTPAQATTRKRSASSMNVFSPNGASLEPNGICARSFQLAGRSHSRCAASSTTGL